MTDFHTFSPPRRWLDEATGRVETYRAYLPVRLEDRRDLTQVSTSRALASANQFLGRLDRFVHPLADPLLRALLRVEAIGSSWHEGIRIGHARLEEAIAGLAAGDDQMAISDTARSVIGNVRAMQKAIELASEHAAWSDDLLLQIHRLLFTNTRDHVGAGEFRDGQSWIGGSTPSRARYVAPPVETLPGYRADLYAFADRTDVDPVIQAAIVHAQFELLHPFPDGNGRVGRCLIHALLRQKGALTRMSAPISQVIAGNSEAYIAGMTAFQFGSTDEWVRVFTGILAAATTRTLELEEELSRLVDSWADKLSGFRRHSTVRSMPAYLLERPVLTSSDVQRQFNVSFEAARRTTRALEAEGILAERNIGKNRRGFRATQLLSLIGAFEKDLRSVRVAAP